MAKQMCPPCKKGAPEWLNTYGDMVTLLLTFFVLLFSFSSMRTEEFKRGMGSLKGAFGVLPKEVTVTEKPFAVVPQLTNLQESEIQNTIVKFEEMASDMQLTESVKLQITDTGLKIQIGDPVLFDRGRAELKPKIYPLLNFISALARGWPNQVVIEGHTDDYKISTEQYPSNWELSTARALAVLHYFEDFGSLEPTRLTAIGYGQYRPIVPNTSEENRSKNRRIEIRIDYDEESGPPPDMQEMENMPTVEETQ